MSSFDLEEIIITKLDKLQVQYSKSGDSFLLSTCLNPNHNDTKPSFSINTDTGFCKCFTCGYKLDKYYWLNDIIDEEQLEDLERASMYHNIFKKTEQQEAKVVKNVYPPITEELEHWRGLNKDTCHKFGLYITRVGKYKDRVVFPINDNHFETRTLVNDDRKYMHSYGFSPTEFVYPLSRIEPDITDYVVITEGIIDCLLMNQDGIPAICNFGVAGNLLSNKNIKSLLEAGIDRIYLAFDRDEAGDKATSLFMNDETLNEYFEVKIGEALPELAEFYKTQCKDYGEYYDKK